MHKLIFIHGGEVFKNDKQYLDYLLSRELEVFESKESIKKWKEELFEKLSLRGWKILVPQMPCKENAKYELWKTYFEKFTGELDKSSALVGHSLGASFLLQYFQENELGHFAQLHLVAPAYNLNAGGFVHKENFSLLEKQFDKIFIYHSQDDPVVPFEDSKTLASFIPKAEFIQFQNKGHFLLGASPEIEKYLL